MKIKEITEGFIYERKKPTKKDCLKPGLSAFDDAHCKNKGWKARTTKKKFTLNGKRQSVFGKRIRGGGKPIKKGGGGGRIPDYTNR